MRAAARGVADWHAADPCGPAAVVGPTVNNLGVADDGPYLARARLDGGAPG